MGTSQVGTGQVGTGQVGAGQVETSQEGTGQVGTSQVGTSQVGTGSLSGNGLVGTRPGGPARAPSRRHPRQSQTCRRRLQWRVARHDARHAYHEDPMRNVRRDERYTACAIHRMHHTCQHAAWALVVTGRALVRRQRQHEGKVLRCASTCSQLCARMDTRERADVRDAGRVELYDTCHARAFTCFGECAADLRRSEAQECFEPRPDLSGSSAASA